MTRPQFISGQQGAAIFIALSSSAFWIGEILRRTAYDGKVPGMYMPDWMTTLWILCLVGLPPITLILALRIHFDRSERITSSFLWAVALGISPALSFMGYMLALR